MRFIWDLYEMDVGFIWDFYGIYMGFIWGFILWDLYEIFMGALSSTFDGQQLILAEKKVLTVKSSSVLRITDFVCSRGPWSILKRFV